MRNILYSTCITALGVALSGCIGAAGTPDAQADAESFSGSEGSNSNSNSNSGSGTDSEPGESSTAPGGDEGAGFVAACGGTQFLLIADHGVTCADLGASELIPADGQEPQICRARSIEVIEQHSQQIQWWMEDCPVIAPAGLSDVCVGDVLDVLDLARGAAAGMAPKGDPDATDESGPVPLIIVLDAIEATITISDRTGCDVLDELPVDERWHAVGLCHSLAAGLGGRRTNLQFMKMLSLDEGRLSARIGDWVDALQTIAEKRLEGPLDGPITIVLAHGWDQSLGAKSDYNEAQRLIVRRAFDSVQAATDPSVMFVASSGNTVPGCLDVEGPVYPAVVSGDRRDTVSVAATDLDGHPGPSTRPGSMYAVSSPGQALISRNDVCSSSVASSWATAYLAGLLTHMRTLDPQRSVAEHYSQLHGTGSCVTTRGGAPVLAEASQLGMDAPIPAIQTNECRALNATDGGDRDCSATLPVCLARQSKPLLSSVQGQSEAQMGQGPGGPGSLAEAGELSPTPLREGPGTQAVIQLENVGPHRRDVPLSGHEWHHCINAAPGVTVPSLAGPFSPTPASDCHNASVDPTPPERRCDGSCAGSSDGTDVTIHLKLGGLTGPDDADTSGGTGNDRGGETGGSFEPPSCSLEVERDDGTFHAPLHIDDLETGHWYVMDADGFHAAYLRCTIRGSTWVDAIPVVHPSLVPYLVAGPPMLDCGP